MQNNWIESDTEWVDFSHTSSSPVNNAQGVEHELQPTEDNLITFPHTSSSPVNNAQGEENEFQSSEDSLTLPKLSLSLEHYKMIAEKVFLSYLRAFRKFYTGEDVSIEKVSLLGSRLRAFLIIVIPSHKDYNSPSHSESTRTIKNLTRQLDEYCIKASEKMPGTEKSSGFESRSHGNDKHQNGLSLFADVSLDEQDSDPHEALWVESNGNDSGSESYNPDEVPQKPHLRLSSSDEQTFCSSEGSSFDSSTLVQESDFPYESQEFIQSGQMDQEENVTESSICFSDSSSFAWDTQSISASCGQIESNNSLDSPEAMPDFEVTDGWNNETPCEAARTDFESLIKHWKDKELRCINTNCNIV